MSSGRLPIPSGIWPTYTLLTKSGGSDTGGSGVSGRHSCDLSLRYRKGGAQPVPQEYPCYCQCAGRPGRRVVRFRVVTFPQAAKDHGPEPQLWKPLHITVKIPRIRLQSSRCHSISVWMTDQFRHDGCVKGQLVHGAIQREAPLKLPLQPTTKVPRGHQASHLVARAILAPRSPLNPAQPHSNTRELTS